MNELALCNVNVNVLTFPFMYISHNRYVINDLANIHEICRTLFHLYTMAIQKVTANEPLAKQVITKEVLPVYKNTYILKLLFSIVTAGVEAFVILGNIFLYTYAKEACHL
jgi:hypothetical protein